MPTGLPRARSGGSGGSSGLVRAEQQAAAMGSLISKVLDSLSALGGKAEKRILYVAGRVECRSINVKGGRGIALRMCSMVDGSIGPSIDHPHFLPASDH